MSASTAGQPEHGFPTDSVGNLVMHPNESNTASARVKFQPSGMIVVFIIDLIMCLTGKDRNEAGETWRRLPDDTKALIQSDLPADEGKTKTSCFYIIFLDKSVIKQNA